VFAGGEDGNAALVLVQLVSLDFHVENCPWGGLVGDGGGSGMGDGGGKRKRGEGRDGTGYGERTYLGQIFGACSRCSPSLLVSLRGV